MQERQSGRYIKRGSQYYQAGPSQKQSPESSAEQDNLNGSPRTIKTAKKRSLLPLYVAIMLILSFGITGILLLKKFNNPLPASISSQITFPVYLPDDSKGVLIDKDSFSVNEGALTYTARTPDKTTVFLSEQYVPKSFDLTTFLQHVKSKQTLTNKYGQGQLGISENNLIVSEIIGDTWIFMSGPVDMDPAQLKLVFQSLRKY